MAGGGDATHTRGPDLTILFSLFNLFNNDSAEEVEKWKKVSMGASVVVVLFSLKEFGALVEGLVELTMVYVHTNLPHRDSFSPSNLPSRHYGRPWAR